MSKTSVLGRGLGNLIQGNGSKNTGSSEDVSNSNLKEIKIADIRLNPNQPRKNFSQETILELAETIKAHGLIQPIVVKKTADGFELVAGERRLRACREAGFVKIPAIIKNFTERESIEVALLENIQREDLNPMEEASAYQKIIDKYSIKVTELAERLGKNRSTVANLIRLLQLPPEVQEMVSREKLSEGQARPLLSLYDKKKMIEVAEEVAKKGMTVREVEELVAKLTTPAKNKKAGSKIDPNILELESKIRNKVSGKVKIQHNEKNGKGRIVVSYSDLEELEKILSRIGIR